MSVLRSAETDERHQGAHVSIAAHFVHTCTVWRDGAEGESPYGGPSAPELTIVERDVPCRLVEKQDRVMFGLLQGERVQSMVVGGYLLLLGPDVDVNERDLVDIGDDRYRISTLARRNSRAGHHQSARLERVY